MDVSEQILNGWENFMEAPEVTEEETMRRLEKCVSCDNKEKVDIPAFVNNEVILINGYKCTICHCPLCHLIRAEKAKCEINKW